MSRGYRKQGMTLARQSCGAVRGVAAGLLGIFAGVVLSGGVMLPARAQADTTEAIPNSQVELFAKVVLELEPFRQDALERSDRANDESTKLTIKREYIRKATEVIETHDLTVPDYNRITIQLKDDETLKSRIETEILRLQKQEAVRP
ncbi:MAG: DUF4168 domain-containing protein [Cyanobacteria bacterium J06648_11]